MIYSHTVTVGVSGFIKTTEDTFEVLKRELELKLRKYGILGDFKFETNTTSHMILEPNYVRDDNGNSQKLHVRTTLAYLENAALVTFGYLSKQDDFSHCSMRFQRIYEE
jgi:hypothetical protein